ncbi:flavin reductase family protein [Bradyrhizobium sp.]|uniref:flavin reductase family protein n=1 Tax=Bradyrhizobium sp. TaxID=376 RepID=UPI002D2F689B|nr:flavin reductase family protein [Bradyrhizobium sp.]HZR73549.1 flavin reductase family protein [Bradyrhizobium sp.]
MDMRVATTPTLQRSEPPILYVGTPVVLISTSNEDGLPNLAPMSSAFWLGWRGVLGLDRSSKTVANMLRTKECVLNLPSVAQADAVDRIALTTGSEVLPPHKVARGYRFEKDKFGTAGLTPIASETIDPPRAKECPIQMEAVVEHTYEMSDNDPAFRGRRILFELRIQRVFADSSILADGEPDRIDPDKWRPLIMSFQKLYGLSDRQARTSRLSQIPEPLYKHVDIERSRSV